MRSERKALFVGLISAIAVAAAGARPNCGTPTASLLASGIQGAIGSTVGPDRALYVTEGKTGRVLRVDPNTGETTVFASGLPPSIIPGLGGPMDVAFLGHTAYVLVTLVDPGVGGKSVDGIYRV